jgi:hypothetical protein
VESGGLVDHRGEHAGVIGIAVSSIERYAVPSAVDEVSGVNPGGHAAGPAQPTAQLDDRYGNVQPTRNETEPHRDPTRVAT